MSKTIVPHHTTETLLPENMERHCLNWSAGKLDSKIIKPQYLTVSLMARPSIQRSVRVGLHCQAKGDNHPWRQCSLSGLKLQLHNEMETVTHALRWIASRGAVRPRTHQPHTATYSISLLQAVKGGPGSPNWHVSVRQPPSKTLDVVWWTCRSEEKWPSR